MTELRFKDIAAGTISEPLTITIKRGSSAVNLSAAEYTSTFKMTNTAGTVIVTAAACTETSLGVVSWQPLAANVATAGNYLCEFTVLYSGATWYRTMSPINWRIRAAL